MVGRQQAKIVENIENFVASKKRKFLYFITFIEDPKPIDKIIRHLMLSFQAERPPPSQIVQQELLVAAEQWSEYVLDCLYFFFLS